ncbi:hypothetical protein J4460_02900 [Candidatus Woesearchaeota archaeon]|nr:MAG: hypothetical protein QS99_C0006G0005 [archaeon GW2011_AR4]MBS3129596.1 hypothetical protein [Candidatus Woesearchaeota archaeon]HIH37695.1 hypothetical protein [Candidatus Woesearchaeota archaeon]HIH49055.1 hypothetical protein [Candidatus Woesearchaeota archaeon]HIJ02906.1 hypothetical protein [Candidatus Woesearchaeota archaeon]
MDHPHFILRPALRRVIIPEALKAAALAALLSVGMLLNVKLVERNISSGWLIAAVLFSLALVTLDFILIYLRHESRAYHFYQDHFIVDGKKLPFGKVAFTRNHLDKLCNTITMHIGNERIPSLDNEATVLFHVQKHIETAGDCD